MLKIRYGVNTLNVDINGMITVGELRRRCSTAMSIPADAQARVGTQPVDDNVGLYDGMSIDFVKYAGEKGTVTVKSGVNSMNSDGLINLTVREVYERTRSAMNLVDGLEVRVNGIKAEGNTIVSDNSTVEFVKVAGEKGN